jgi:hypothetical protein
LLIFHLPKLNDTVFIDKDVTWLDVSVYHIGGMQIQQSPEDLVEDEFIMIIRELLIGLNDLIQIGIHFLKDQINISDLLDIIPRLNANTYPLTNITSNN